MIAYKFVRNKIMKYANDNSTEEVNSIVIFLHSHDFSPL